MSARNVQFAQAWLKKAEHDLITARAVLVLPNGPTDTPSFHAQQAVEKALKGLLTLHGITFSRTHDLFVLLDCVLAVYPQLIVYESVLGLMNGYAVETRYPGDILEPDRAEVVQAVQTAEEIVELVSNLLHPPILTPPASKN
ncbi:MAG: HEPN domain-containing protein [Magnetococcales bacterium]|nr:HEPN domain-containing protein [Magnetococcales bacterium]MBF0115865.1 HEPN domain-containing protein [Magnetococcales bacterium]